MKNELLGQVRCFARLDAEALAKVEAVLEPVTFAAGAEVCKEGELGDCLYIIETGVIEVLKDVDNDTTIVVTELRGGDIAGEMGLFGQKRRTASLRTKTEVTAYSLAYSTFEKMMKREGAVAHGMLEYVCGNLQEASSTVAKLLAKDNMEKRLRVFFFQATPFRDNLYRDNNEHHWILESCDVRLSLSTVALATGADDVVVSANDTVDAVVVAELAALGVKMIALRCAGFNNVDLEACEKNKISVARVPAYSPYAIAEHAMALIMALNRRIHRANNRVREGNFSLEGLLGFDLHGRTAGIIGTGKIGACLISILHGCGCKLLAYDVYENQDLKDKFGLQYVTLEELLAKSDLVSLHAPLIPATYHMINTETIAKMKRGVMLINTSRGALVDTLALVEGLKSGQIGYAGLDVYEEEAEYFFEDHSDRVITDDVLARLTTFNNVMITSHQGSFTDVAQNKIVETVIANIREFELGKRGKDLSNAVLSSAFVKKKSLRNLNGDK